MFISANSLYCVLSGLSLAVVIAYLAALMAFGRFDDGSPDVECSWAVLVFNFVSVFLKCLVFYI